MKERYYRLVLHHLLKHPNEMLNITNDDCEEEYEKVVSNAAWSENFYVRRIREFYYMFTFYMCSKTHKGAGFMKGKTTEPGYLTKQKAKGKRYLFVKKPIVKGKK
ncbi:hypothetical protein [Priestia megaterium]|uniref:hypothetical protein n=1 Tax=Priestia megaterium TaxID=1404 RepID=UPI00366CB074